MPASYASGAFEGRLESFTNTRPFIVTFLLYYLFLGSMLQCGTPLPTAQATTRLSCLYPVDCLHIYLVILLFCNSAVYATPTHAKPTVID